MCVYIYIYIYFFFYCYVSVPQHLLLSLTHFLLLSTEPKKRQCKVLFEYNPINEDELELKVGDIVDILEEVLQTCLP